MASETNKLNAIENETTPVESNNQSPTAVPSSTDIFNDLDALRENSKPTVRRRSVLTPPATPA
jgi:hypothetical protein